DRYSGGFQRYTGSLGSLNVALDRKERPTGFVATSTSARPGFGDATFYFGLDGDAQRSHAQPSKPFGKRRLYPPRTSNPLRRPATRRSSVLSCLRQFKPSNAHSERRDTSSRSRPGLSVVYCRIDVRHGGHELLRSSRSVQHAFEIWASWRTGAAGLAIHDRRGRRIAS